MLPGEDLTARCGNCNDCNLGKDPGKLQTALEAAQGVLLDVEAGAAA